LHLRDSVLYPTPEAPGASDASRRNSIVRTKVKATAKLINLPTAIALLAAAAGGGTQSGASVVQAT